MLCPCIDLSPPIFQFFKSPPPCSQHLWETLLSFPFQFARLYYIEVFIRKFQKPFKKRHWNELILLYYCYYSIINSVILYFSVSFTNDQNARPFKQKMVPTLLFVTERTLLLWLKNFMSLPKHFVWPPFSHSKSSFYEWWSKNNMCSHVENTIGGSLSEAPSSFYFLGIQTCSNIPFIVRF